MPKPSTIRWTAQDREVLARLKSFRPVVKEAGGALQKYRALVGSACDGAVLR